MSPFAERVRILSGSGELQEGAPIAPYTTLRVGGPAQFLFMPERHETLIAVVDLAAKSGCAVTVMGQGSNMLIPDDGLDGLVLQLQRLERWAKFSGNRILAGAAYPVPRLVNEAARHGLSGLEGLVGIPGSVGGALAMNAGTVNGCIGDTVQRVEVLVPNEGRRWLSKEEMAFGYRSSILQERPWIALRCELELQSGDVEEITARTRKYDDYRRRTQPLSLHNAGSIFRNPPGDHSGRLIEAAGCKGRRCGGAQVSEMHANFIVNTGSATAEDVFTLMCDVRQAVWDRFGVMLEPEIRLMGDFARRWREAVKGGAAASDQEVH